MLRVLSRLLQVIIAIRTQVLPTVGNSDVMMEENAQV
jgi:hypothetical protein